MPRQADHDARRRQIAEAVWRIAGRSGLEDVTLRQVAAEAGVPVRSLQYYFGTRDDLLLGALEILNATAREQAHERLAGLGASPGLRDLVRGVLLELLPLDEERRARHLVYAAYFVRFLADAKLGASVRDAPAALEELLATLIGEAQRAGGTPGDIDPAVEGALLVAAAEGLQAEVLLGQREAADAVGLIDYRLHRLFTTSSAA